MILNNLLNKAQEAYETSTKNNNRFAAFVKSYDWDDAYKCEDGNVFIKGDYELNCDGLDPFMMDWKPFILCSNEWGAVIEFK